MAIRAIAFDYGMVLSGPPLPHAHEQLKAITGLPHDEFERYYWADRLAYDRGDLTGLEFWQKIVADAQLMLTPEEIDKLNLWDAKLWTTTNTEMIAWYRLLKTRGFKLAILSNMGDSVLDNMKREFEWLGDFDVLIWSYQHRIVKPQPEIYRLLLDRLGTAAEETLFLDDRLENIEGARHLGIQAIQFSTVEKLRQDLISLQLDEVFPLP